MSNFDFTAGKRFREEGDIVEAIRCLKSALEQDRDHVESYIELCRTYAVAFHESGDPLCLDSARKVCLSGQRRDGSEEQRKILAELQEQIEGLLLESQKAEMDAITDALDQVPTGPGLLPDDEPEHRPLDNVGGFRDPGPDEKPGP